MKLKEWFKNQVAAIAFAVSNVEKNVLNQDGKNLDENTGIEKRNTQGTLADALIHGEVTQEVKNLRWRMYKMLQASQGLSSRIVGGLTDDDIDNPDLADTPFTVTTEFRDKKTLLEKVKIDTYDTYQLEMVVDNSYIPEAMSESPDSKVVSANEYFSRNKGVKPIQVVRESPPKFYLETYTKKLNIRTIDNEKKLIEFYVSKYPDEYNPNSVHFIREIKKLIEFGPSRNSFLDIKEVGFITDNTLGVDDYLCYGYNITSFDKIVEFDGYYVIKFLGEVVINGNNVLDKFI